MSDTPENTLPVPMQDQRSIKLWFTQIYGKIDELHAGIFAKRGVLFFKTHTHTQDDLLNHPLFDSIRALCGQIDNVVQHWIANNNADGELASFYYENRILVEQKLSSLRAEIVARKPTFWEALLHTLESLIRHVLNVLPVLPAVLMERLGIRIAPAQQYLMDKSNEIDALLAGLIKK
jgi:hypothetical protein